MRLQLTAARSGALSAALLLLSGGAAEADVEARARVAGYTDSDNVSVLTPSVDAAIGDASSGLDVSGSYLVDVVTAASVDIVSTATPRWTEVRHAASLGASKQWSPITVGANGSFSVEPDYLSLTAGPRLSFELDEKHIQPTIAYSLTRDEAGRSGTPFNVYSLVVLRHRLLLSSSFVIDRSSELIAGGEVWLEDGDQEKPYRYVPLFDANVAPTIRAGEPVERVNALRLPGRLVENTPDARQRYVAFMRYSRRGRRYTLHATERLYTDSWGQDATTTDVHLLQDVGARFRIDTHLRGHLQTATSFWRRAYVGSVQGEQVVFPKLRTGDRELGPLWSTTFGVGARWEMGPRRAPDRLALSGFFDATLTRFTDTLFITRRVSGLLALGLEWKP